MYHLLFTCCLIVITLGMLTRRYPVEAAFSLLVPFPTLLFFAGLVDEYFRNIQQFNHQLLHVAYDSSYALLLVGIVLVLRAVLKRTRRILVVAGTCMAGIPLGHLYLTQH
ncbi:MAG TPA: hypothetical protein VN843_33005 [Anaerolineales bacterium]|nr:hypothetical protein [Anaerolineales bacterium]